MSKWITTNMKVYGKKKNLEKFRDEVKDERRSVISFQKIEPVPEITDYWATDIIPGWHNYRLHYWGTERDALGPDLKIKDDHLLYNFESVWYPPIPIFIRLINSYKELDFEINTYEPLSYWDLVIVSKNCQYVKFHLERSEYIAWNNHYSVLLYYRHDFLLNKINHIKTEICKNKKNEHSSNYVSKESRNYPIGIKELIVYDKDDFLKSLYDIHCNE